MRFDLREPFGEGHRAEEAGAFDLEPVSAVTPAEYWNTPLR